MFKNSFLISFFAFIIFVFGVKSYTQSQIEKDNIFKPLSYEQSEKMADSVLALMNLDEKIAYIGGDKSFFIRAIP
ncbi:MAG: hypothetical protein WCE54_12925, partial [Ignavibacteriaceae bacterium]